MFMMMMIVLMVMTVMVNTGEFHQTLCTAGRWLTSGDDHDDDHNDCYEDDHDDDYHHDFDEFSSVSSFGKCVPHFTELLTDKSYHSSISSFTR